MNVYDFDGTVFDGDSSVEFMLFCIKRHKKSICFFPDFLIAFIKYQLGFLNKTKLKEAFFSFLVYIPDGEKEVLYFWKKYQNKIYPWYLRQRKNNDVIISASPFFLLKPICNQMGIQYLIASNVDIHTGKFLSENCHDEMKPIRFKEKFPQGKINAFYSDSLSDSPMAELAERAYLVQKGKVSKWPIL